MKEFKVGDKVRVLNQGKNIKFSILADVSIHF